MSFSRYLINRKIRNNTGVATNVNMVKIFNAVERGAIPYETYILEEGQRLDQIAGSAYQDAGYWWVIAAASGIGWGLQVPPGTVLRIPKNLGSIMSLLT